MPRRNDPSQARSAEISVFVRNCDFENLVKEAHIRRISLSRYLYHRIMATAPIPSEGNLALARELGRLGNNLNQCIRLWHSHGYCTAVAEESLKAVADLNRMLVMP